MSTTEELMLFGISFAVGFIIAVVAVVWSFLRKVEGKPKVFCQKWPKVDDPIESMDGGCWEGTVHEMPDGAVEMVWSFLPDKEPRCNPWFKGVAQSPARSNKHYEQVWMGEYKRCDEDDNY